MAAPKGSTSRRRAGAAAKSAAVGAVVLVVAVAALVAREPSDPSVIVGSTGEVTSTPRPSPTVLVPEEEATTVETARRRPAPEPGPAVGLKVANGKPGAPPIEFRSDIAVPDHLVFVLVIGSDARPNEPLLSTRADALQLVALNPVTQQGTIVGIPRDSYVQFPRGRPGKINDALARGGPKYVAETVRLLTGLPVDYFVLTGFDGLQRLVDELGGVDVHVDRRMNDRLSGARFEKGWHHMSGGEALAFSRNRNDVADGDFSRSRHQGELLLAGLVKLRSEVGDDPGLLQRLDVLRRHCRFDVPAADLPRLAALARRTAPERISHVVLPGRAGSAGGASVVYLTRDARQLFLDLRDDAVIGAPSEAPGSPTTAPPPSTTSTASPQPTTSTTERLPPPSTTDPSPPSPTPSTTTTEPSSSSTTTSPLGDL